MRVLRISGRVSRAAAHPLTALLGISALQRRHQAMLAYAVQLQMLPSMVKAQNGNLLLPGMWGQPPDLVAHPPLKRRRQCRLPPQRMQKSRRKLLSALCCLISDMQQRLAIHATQELLAARAGMVHLNSRHRHMAALRRYQVL